MQPGYEVGSDVRRSADGRLLAGGSPPRLIRLSAAGARALDHLLAGEEPGEAAAEALRDRLLSHGFIHPVPAAPAEVTFAIPVRDGGPALAGLIRSLREWGDVIVVDDRSADDSAALARQAGARVIGNDRAPGPAGARNMGLAAAETEFVAFVDADCLCPTDWARPLAGLLVRDPDLGLVAPRVLGAPGRGLIARYERAGSPLDMGPDSSLVGPGRRVAYVPSTAVVVRRRALLELGGFDESLRFGEDVDIVFRLIAAGWSVRYAPARALEHRPRPSLLPFLRQRFDYGSSAAALDRRHPGTVAPLRVDRTTVATALAGAGFGAPGAATVVIGASALAASRRRDPAAVAAVARLSLTASGGAVRQLARAVARDWLPLTAAAAVRSPRMRRLALAAVVLDATAATRLRPGPGAILLRPLENAAYSAGLWRGALASRSLAALLPRRAQRRPHLAPRRSP